MFILNCFYCIVLVIVSCVVDLSHAGVVSTEASASSEPVVVTPSGRIRGSWMTSRRGRRIEAYRGIRYAEPPVGELRFQPPKLIRSYTGEVDAREEGPACHMPTAPETVRLLDEDCLRVNVYTSSCNSSQQQPVLVFMHPGGFYSFSGRSTVFGPEYLLDQDLVLVTFNYRLASLGFLSTGDELAPGNNGFKDQVAALRWVQNNIAAFGGNSRLVTISGCSAGSASVVLHMVSPMSTGLFHRAIAMSGSPVSKGPSPVHQRGLAVKQAQLVGCPTDTSKAIIDCLKTKPWKQISDTLSGFYEFGFDPVRIWDAVVEPDFGQERFLTIQPADAIRKGTTVPLIVSQTADEFFWKAFTVLNNMTLLNTMNSDWERVAPIAFMLPRDETSTRVSNHLKEFYLHGQKLANDTRSATQLGRLYADAITGFPVHRLANLMCRHSLQPVYYYEFNYIGNNSFYEDPVTGKPTGVAHQDDLLYLFPLAYRFPGIPLSSPDSFMVDRMTDLFYNFAKYGDPNRRGDLDELTTPLWPQMKPKDRRYLRIGKELSVERNLGEERYRVLWDELYKFQY